MASSARSVKLILVSLLLIGNSVLYAVSVGPFFRVALDSIPTTLDWHLWPDGFGSPIYLALSGSLVDFDPQTGLARAGLAESWTTSEDRRTWNFLLRTARWSDGSALTSQEVMASWARSVQVAPPDPLGLRISAMNCPDSRRFQVSFDRPIPSEAVFGSYRWAIVPSPGIDKGIGPFLLKNWAPGQSLAVVKNMSYWNSASVNLAEIAFIAAGPAEGGGLLYKNQEVDWVANSWGPGTFVNTTAPDSVATPAWGSIFLRLNLSHPLLKDSMFRHALNNALDRTQLLKGLRGPFLISSETVVPGSQKKPVAGAARKKGAMSGTLTIAHLVGETNQKLATGIAFQWSRALGLNVETKALSLVAYSEDRMSGNYDLVLSGWIGDYADPMTFLELFRSREASTDGGYRNQQYDRLLDEALSGVMLKDRSKLLEQAQEKLLIDLPVLPIASYGSINQINLKRWSGWYANPTDIHPWVGVAPRK